jgi:phosphatidate cytidylyltransferase
MFFVNKNKDKKFSKNNWVKYIVYFILINIIFGSIIIDSFIFFYVCILIVTLGYCELIRIIYFSRNIRVGIVALLIFSFFTLTFYHFALMPKNYLFYTLYLTTVFDAFSQLAGQLFGKTKLIAKISPNKTVEGLLGGIVFSVLTSVLIRNLLDINIINSIILGLGVATFAFGGDVLASYCKRKFNIKDFSYLIPGHGGIIDRFDSLLSAGSFVFLVNILAQI